MNTPPTLVARVNKKKMYMMAGLAVAAYALLYFFLDRFELIVFGVCIAIAVGYTIKEAFFGDSRIIINERGVFDSRMGLGTIRWTDITRVHIAEFNSIAHVCLEVIDPDRYLKQRSFAVRGLLKFHEKKNKISPFNINAGVLDVGAGEIYEVIIENWEFYGRR